MSPKPLFNRETIIDKGLMIAKKEGLKAITARRIAKELKSSVAPIYVNFETIDDLIHAVVLKVFQMTEAIILNTEGNSTFEKIGKASLHFARNYPMLFRELSIEPNPYMASYEIVENMMIESLKNDSTINFLSEEKLKMLFLKLRIFQMGLSVMISNGQKPNWMSDHDMENLLISFGDDMRDLLNMKEKT
jgi:AcrR family transcriptional regulator